MEVITWNQINIHNKRKTWPRFRSLPLCSSIEPAAVIVLNVLSYYSPLRHLIKNGIENGFIRPENGGLVVFVDGPADHAMHEDFEWGKAALEAINSWNYHHFRPLPFHWKKDVDYSDVPPIKAEMKPTESTLGLSVEWLKRVWHVRNGSARV